MANHLTWTLIDETADRLGAKFATRAKWRQRGRGVPPAWQIAIVKELASKGVTVSLDEFAKLPVASGRALTERAA